MKKQDRRMSLLWLVSLLFVITTCAFAQAPDTLWTKTYGGIDYDFGYGVKETTDGGYIIAGQTEYGYAYIIKTDSSGDTLWSKIYGNGYDSRRFFDVVQANDGGYVFIGSGWIGMYESDLWLVKTDSVGDTLWTQVYGLMWCDDGYSIKQTNDGGYILVGELETYGGYSYIWLLKTDSLGVYECGNMFLAGRGFEVQITNDGGYIIAGGSSALGPSGYIVKTDSLCNLEWEKHYGGERIGIQSICHTDDGGYMAVGCSGLDRCILLLKINDTGDTLWTKKYKEGSVPDWPYNSKASKMTIRPCPGNKYVISASIGDYNNADICLLKIDNQGNVLWEKILGGSNNEFVWSIEPTSDSGYIVIGCTESYGAGYSDIWLVKLETDTFGISEKTNNSVTHHKLPATIISGPLLLPEGNIYKVFDITGRTIEPNKIKPGIYFIEIDGKITRKVVKVR